MQVSEAQRRELFDRVRAHLDEETATLLLEVTVPANVDLATRGDIQELRAEMLLRSTQLDGRLSDLGGRLDRRIDGVEFRLAGVEQRLTGVEQRLTGIDLRLTGVEQRLDVMEQRLTSLDDRLTGVEQRLTGVEVSIVELGASLSRQLLTVAVPILIGATALIVAFATWIGQAFG